MPKAKRRPIDTRDIPELTQADLKHARRVTPKETEAFRRGIERKLGIPRPRRIGRPPKHPTEKYVPISWRTPPEVRDWLVTQARHAGVGKYQTFLSLLLRGLLRYDVEREGGGVVIKLPASEHVIVLASKETLGRMSHSKPAQ